MIAGSTRRPEADLAASIIVEWENVRLAGLGRAREMLTRLLDQADALRRAGARPEILIVHPVEEVSEPSLDETLSGWLGPAERDCIELIAAPTSDYYALKNFAADHARGELIVFLDSDVIPDPGWLARLVACFDDPGVHVVAGSAYLETASWIHKALALGWYFPLRTSATGTRPTRRFFANNVAFRREVFRGHPFPAIPGASRGACQALADELQTAGIPILESSDARVCHPAPRGLVRTLERALAEGRDRLLHGRSDPRRSTALRTSARRAAKRTVRAANAILNDHAAVDLPRHQIPAALCLTTVYHGSVLLGDVMTRAFPDVMRRRFQI